LGDGPAIIRIAGSLIDRQSDKTTSGVYRREATYSICKGGGGWEGRRETFPAKSGGKRNWSEERVKSRSPLYFGEKEDDEAGLGGKSCENDHHTCRSGDRIDVAQDGEKKDTKRTSVGTLDCLSKAAKATAEEERKSRDNMGKGREQVCPGRERGSARFSTTAR